MVCVVITLNCYFFVNGLHIVAIAILLWIAIRRLSLFLWNLCNNLLFLSSFYWLCICRVWRTSCSVWLWSMNDRNWNNVEKLLFKKQGL